MCIFRQNIISRNVWKILHEPLYGFLTIAVFIFILVLILKVNVDTFFTTIAGAFFGAGAAFFLNTFHSKKKKRSSNIASLEKAKYSIIKILKTNQEISDWIAERVKNHDDRFFEWEEIPGYDPSFFFAKN